MRTSSEAEKHKSGNQFFARVLLDFARSTHYCTSFKSPNKPTH